jgi:hypothetical protein
MFLNQSIFGLITWSVLRARVRVPVAVGTLLLSLASADGLPAALANLKSPVGVNVAGLNYYSSEIPLLNIFNMTGAWVTHSEAIWDTQEERHLKLDADGWPMSLNAVDETTTQQFSSVGVLLLSNLPNTVYGNYPGGRYIVLYDGEGTIMYSLAATKNAALSKPGRDVIDVIPSEGGGISLAITSTDPNRTGDYVRNIRVVQAENEAALKAGNIFNPKFVSLMQKFRVIRFMDWLQTNNSPLTNWASRPLPSNAFLGDQQWRSDRNRRGSCQ